MTSSRILARNCQGFECEVEECETGSIPQPCDPRRPEWQWPTDVNNPVKFAVYVRKLHEQKGLRFSFPLGMYQRFAGKHWDVGPEVLCRAAYLAALRANHPFSAKFIGHYLDEVPHKPKPIKLF